VKLLVVFTGIRTKLNLVHHHSKMTKYICVSGPLKGQILKTQCPANRLEVNEFIKFLFPSNQARIR